MAAPQVPGWQARILQGVGAPVTPENLRAVDAWAQAEGGNASNNPFNTTEPGYNATGNYNSVGVKNYGNPQSGIAATIATLRNGHYGNILSALHQGNNAMSVAQAIAASPWGTGSLVEKVLGGPVSAPSTPPTVATQMPSGGPVSPSNATVAPINAGGSLSRQQLAQMLFGGSNRVDFSSNQIQTPNLLALAQIRQQTSGTLAHVPAPVAAAHVTGKADSVGSAVAKSALSQLGQPYQWGGLAKLGSPTDCSGLLQAACAAHGISIPRTTYDQWQTGKAVPRNALQPGDAVFFRGSDPRGNLPGHVGIYIGGGKFVEDPHTGGTVSISVLAGRTDYVGARRFA